VVVLLPACSKNIRGTVSRKKATFLQTHLPESETLTPADRDRGGESEHQLEKKHPEKNERNKSADDQQRSQAAPDNTECPADSAAADETRPIEFGTDSRHIFWGETFETKRVHH
jgi:hypothetical protein